MRVLVAVFTLLLAALAAYGAALPGPPPNQVPKFELLLYGELVLGPFDTFKGPFGTRINVPLLPEGSFRDATGKPVAEVLGGAIDGGLVSESAGLFFPDMKMALRFTDDQSLMSFAGSASENFTSRVIACSHVETDSPSRMDLNGKFVVGNITFPAINASHDRFMSLKMTL